MQKYGYGRSFKTQIDKSENNIVGCDGVVVECFFFQEIGLAHAKVVDGLTTLLCLSGLLSRMYLAAKNSDQF